MFFFKIYTLEKVQNSLTSSKNFFEGVFSTQLESAPKNTFVISQKASRNFSKGVLMIMFNFYTPGKVRNKPKASKNFSRMHSR